MSDTPDSEHIDYSVVKGGLLYRLLSRAGLAQEGPAGIRARLSLLICVTYLPILILAIVQGLAYNSAITVPFLYDIAEACRFLIVGPLLILAEAIIEPWLVLVMKYTRERLLTEDKLPQYKQLMSRAIAMRDSALVEITLLIITFAWQWGDVHLGSPSAVTTWYFLPSTSSPSYAWFWYAFIAKPLIRFLWLRWLWRYLIWSFCLFRLAALDLKVTPTHPDRHGGLGVLAIGHCRFSVLAFAFGIQASSVFAKQIFFAGKTVLGFKYEILGVLLIVFLLFLMPLLAFTQKLLDAKRVGLFDYGALADELTSEFHSKWIHGGIGTEMLRGSSDVAALANLDKTYAVVREMNVCLISKSSILIFLVATLLPIAPLALTIYPFDTLINHLLKAVL